MSDIAIQVENLSKEYRIGQLHRHDTLRDALAAGFNRLRRGLKDRDVRQTVDDRIWALRDVSFKVKHGEVVGIIGRNGAGKSTLLKILSRITEPTSGRAFIHGRVGSLLEVGTGFHPELSGRENIYLSGSILGMRSREIDRRFDEIVDFSGVEKFIDTPIKRYSSGMNVRLGFAVAAHLDPEILIVDEVLAVGDLSFQKKCLGKMSEVSKEGRTVLFVSHNMGAIATLTQSCMLLDSGQVEMLGPSDRVIESYIGYKAVSLERELSSLPRELGDRKDPGVTLTHAHLLSSDKGIIAGTPLNFEIQYTIKRPVNNLKIGIGIANPLGLRLISCRSDDDGLLLDQPAGQTGRVSVCLPTPNLVAGRYLLQIVIMEGIKTLDFLPEALYFEIQPNVKDDWAMNRANLGVRQPSTWKTHHSN